MRQNVCHFPSFTDKARQPNAVAAAEKKMFDRAEIIRWKCHKSNFAHRTPLPTFRYYHKYPSYTFVWYIPPVPASLRVELGHRNDRNQLPEYKWQHSHADHCFNLDFSAKTFCGSMFVRTQPQSHENCVRLLDHDHIHPSTHTHRARRAHRACLCNHWPTTYTAYTYIWKYQIKNNANEHMSKHITLLRLSKLNQIILIYI